MKQDPSIFEIAWLLVKILCKLILLILYLVCIIYIVAIFIILTIVTFGMFGVFLIDSYDGFCRLNRELERQKRKGELNGY